MVKERNEDTGEAVQSSNQTKLYSEIRELEIEEEQGMVVL